MHALFQIVPEAVSLSEPGVPADSESGGSPAEKHAVLGAVAGLMAGAYPALDRQELLESMLERESLGSTGFGRGVAIPHARSARIRRPVAALLRLPSPVEFDASDGMPVDLVFGLVSPETAGATHLHALAALSRMVRTEDMHQAMLDAPDADALFALIANIADRDAA